MDFIGLDIHEEIPEPEPKVRDWHKEAQCLGITALMYPEPWDRQAVKNARAVCDGCQVKEECLTEAIVENEREGVRAGLTPKQRRPLRREYLRSLRDDS